MYKLNNKGWGMITFIILIGLLLFAILLISYLVNQIGGLPLSASRVKKTDNTTYYVERI